MAKGIKAVPTEFVAAHATDCSLVEAHRTKEVCQVNLQPRLTQLWQVPRKLWHYAEKHAGKVIPAPKTMAIDASKPCFLQPRPGNYGIRPRKPLRSPLPPQLVATTPRLYGQQIRPFSLYSNHISQLPLRLLSRPEGRKIVSFCENYQSGRIDFFQHCNFYTHIINHGKLLLHVDQLW